MQNNVTTVSLTDTELALLDGQCQPKVQKEVDLALARLEITNRLAGVPEKFVNLVTRIVEEAKKNEKLLAQRTTTSHCDVCGKDAGYAKYRSNTRYHRKGDTNFKRPLTLSGVEFAKRFLRITNHISVGCCTDCYKEAKPFIVAALVGVKAELPPELQTEGQPVYKRHKLKECTRCGWEGDESQMLLKQSLSGGQYPGRCPQCKTANEFFGPTFIKTVDGYVLKFEWQ